MRRITWAILGWSVLWIILVWAIDPAATANGWGPRRLHLPKPPGWVLFEVWATGFVALGWIWNRVPTATRDQARSAERRLRRMTRVILGWTGLWVGLFVAWALNPAGTFVGDGPPGPRSPISLKPPEWVVFVAWLLGFFVLGVIWLVTRWRRPQHRRPESEGQ